MPMGKTLLTIHEDLAYLDQGDGDCMETIIEVATCDLREEHRLDLRFIDTRNGNDWLVCLTATQVINLYDCLETWLCDTADAIKTASVPHG